MIPVVNVLRRRLGLDAKDVAHVVFSGPAPFKCGAHGLSGNIDNLAREFGLGEDGVVRRDRGGGSAGYHQALCFIHDGASLYDPVCQ